jgi:hypothetical protein
MRHLSPFPIAAEIDSRFNERMRLSEREMQIPCDLD